MELSGLARPAARKLLAAAAGELKPAIVMHARGTDYPTARKLLAACKGSLRQAAWGPLSRPARQQC
jgi:N-acetylmuramic acid 6-phosphate (MurNAc-6-P) etherase